MIYVLVGHRGTGKSDFLRSLGECLTDFDQAAVVTDLDKEIEKATQKSIREIFLNEGEESFRKYEEKILFRYFSEAIGESLGKFIDDNKLIIIALGAGYREILPESVKVIWLKRASDDLGRVFLNRPRLEAQLTPLEEYFSRYEERTIRYQTLADETLHLPENHKTVYPWLPIFWGLQPGELGGILTLLPGYLEDKNKAKSFLVKRLSWGVQFFEVRTDLLSLEQIHWVKETVPDSMILLSIRGKKNIPFKAIHTDWALELDEPDDKFCEPPGFNIVSLHEREKSLLGTFARLENYKDVHLKLAIEINTWSELRQGHLWWQEDPQNRSFLPRSKNGRWEWYRLLHKFKMKMNFFREDIGSSVDQPYFVDWCNFQYFAENKFGAILGHPITHSWTPEEHREFWSKKSCNSLRIDMAEDEWTADNLQFLRELGLTYAAVTSPLKKKAFEYCEERTSEAQQLKAINTIYFSGSKAQGHNTDGEGLLKASEQVLAKTLDKPLDSLNVAIWGGGGTLESLKKVFPKAVQFSARTGKVTNSNFFSRKSHQTHFDVLVWAVGRDRIENGALFPPEDLSFDCVFDLNYADNSPGKELALERKSLYISGSHMFFYQAELQRKFWDQVL